MRVDRRFSRSLHSSLFGMVGPARRSAFTLLEVLLSIAIIALLAGVLIGGSARLLTDEAATPHDIFWKAVQEARKRALTLEHDVRLKFDKEKKQFVIVDGVALPTIGPDGITKEDVPLKTFPIPPAAAADLAVDFLPSGTKGANTILVGGVLLESNPVPFVTFYSDGTCSAFRAQFFRQGAASTLAVDPWTCAPVLAPEGAK